MKSLILTSFGILSFKDVLPLCICVKTFYKYMDSTVNLLLV